MCTMFDVLPEFKGEIPPIARTSRCVLCVSYYPNLRVKYPPIARTSRCVLCVSYYPNLRVKYPPIARTEMCTMCFVLPQSKVEIVTYYLSLRVR